MSNGSLKTGLLLAACHGKQTFSPLEDPSYKKKRNKKGLKCSESLCKTGIHLKGVKVYLLKLPFFKLKGKLLSLSWSQIAS